MKRPLRGDPRLRGEIPTREWRPRYLTGPITREQARIFGAALTVAAHSPPARALLSRLVFRNGRPIEGWSSGGCHVFAAALSRWINAAEQEERASCEVITGDGHLLHVTTRFRGWLFDAWGAWDDEAATALYRPVVRKNCVLRLGTYDPSAFLAVDMPRSAEVTNDLIAVFEEALRTWVPWVPPRDRGPWYAGAHLVPRPERIDARETPSTAHDLTSELTT